MTSELTGAQKILLHLVKEASKAGHDNAWISRESLLDGSLAPKNIGREAGQAAGVKLVFAALTLPEGTLEWSEDQQSFRLSRKSLLASRTREQADTNRKCD